MIYLSCPSPLCEGREDFGVMITPATGVPRYIQRVVWAADNGRFAAPEAYSDERYLSWLDRLTPAWSTCLFATAPDVVGDAATTLALSAPMLPLIRQRVRAAVVAQDGLEELRVPWETFDCLFVGGTTRWKLSEAAWGLVAEAKARGKWVHMGRVNSRRRFVTAAAHGCDSADGTYTAYNPVECRATVERWLRTVREQRPLELKWERPA